MKLFTFAAPLLIGVCVCPIRAQTTADQALAKLKGQPLYLRGHWAENKLSFDADGKPLQTYTQVPFSEAGFDCRTAEIKDATLVLKGRRAGVKFVSDQPIRISPGPDMTIRISLPSDGNLSTVLERVFAPDLAGLVPSMEEYWQPWARAHLLPQNEREEDPYAAGKIFAAPPGGTHIMKGVTPPTVIHSVDPPFSDMARKEKISGRVMVGIWLGTDGTPFHFRVIHPLGLGLDERALAAVSQYKFKPAMQDGHPVKVDLYIDVNFQTF